ncbi:hypothetical protein AB838_07790 [Rhodobacteraceae bacterium (ex Bugula neritina AB1)]|nr:hypothetical protein AB838_07790 [Rhodobacteraceae bacterium (ex Bugula neritina AB1)]
MANAKKPTSAQLDAAMKNVMQQFGHRANFSGVDRGYRYVKGKRTDEVVVRVHVTRKLPESELEAADVFPKQIDGVPLDVIEGDYRTCSGSTSPAHHQARTRAVVGGTSCGREDGTTGSIGMVVLDKRTGRPGILSNWHVLATARARAGDAVVQPGIMDGGKAGRDQVARLSRWMLDAGGDAAFAELDTGRPWLPLQFGSYTQVRSVRRSRLGERLIKSGRSTAVTEAIVDGEGHYRVPYEVSTGRYEPRDIKGFKLVPVQLGNPGNDELSAGGDSGSCWMHEASGAGVGLHFAGETSPDPRAEHAIACNLDTVFERLELDVARFEDFFDEPAEKNAPPAKAELTPRPDWPDWPWWPWWPFPFPVPGQGPWPLPQPFPPRPPRPFDFGRPVPGLSYDVALRGSENAAKDRIKRLLELFELLKGALKAYGLIIPGLEILTPVDSLLEGPANPRATIARAVNRYTPFANIGLRQVMPSEFLDDLTCTDICATIDAILRGEK